jgi:uncharacterized protein YfiM (DUF2279 family)
MLAKRHNECVWYSSGPGRRLTIMSVYLMFLLLIINSSNETNQIFQIEDDTVCVYQDTSFSYCLPRFKDDPSSHNNNYWIPIGDPSVMETPGINPMDDFDANPQSPQDNWIGMDKFWHWLLSFSLVGSSYHLIHNQLDISDPEALIISVSSTFGLGVLKELYDLWQYHLFSYKDLIYDILGIVTGYVIFVMDWY